MATSPEDYSAISDHFARYCHAIDEGRTDEWLSLWTDDGVFAVSGQDPASGREALSAVVDRVRTSGQGKMRHMIANLFCDYEDDHNAAVATYYNFVTNWSEGAKIVALIPSRASIVRRGSQWLIQRIDLSPVVG